MPTNESRRAFDDLFDDEDNKPTPVSKICAICRVCKQQFAYHQSLWPFCPDPRCTDTPTSK